MIPVAADHLRTLIALMRDAGVSRHFGMMFTKAQIERHAKVKKTDELIAIVEALGGWPTVMKLLKANEATLIDTELAEAQGRLSYAYLIASIGGSKRTYVGWTHDVVARLKAHNTGRGAKATRGRQWELLFAESFSTKEAAMSAEYFMKKNQPFRAQAAKHARGMATVG
jgi:putative endonuclease